MEWFMLLLCYKRKFSSLSFTNKNIFICQRVYFLVKEAFSKHSQSITIIKVFFSSYFSMSMYLEFLIKTTPVFITVFKVRVFQISNYCIVKLVSRQLCVAVAPP